jgi:hypothetical protein
MNNLVMQIEAMRKKKEKEKEKKNRLSKPYMTSYCHMHHLIGKRTSQRFQRHQRHHQLKHKGQPKHCLKVTSLPNVYFPPFSQLVP